MGRRVVRRCLPWVLVAALAPVGLWGVARAQAPKTLVIAIGADQTGLDPQTVQNNESGFVMSTIFDSIVNYKPGTSLVGPGLAESWTISPDGRVYTFKLRRGVSFHDGTPMNAHTVAEDVDRAIDPQNPCYVLARKGVDTYDDFTFGSAKDGTVARMDVLDDYTLRFTLPKPDAPFITSLAMVWQGIMSPAATKKYACDASQHPVGTGPFKFVEAVRNDHVTVEANPNYWGGRPKVDRIIFQVVPESATRMLKLERNEVQILADVPPSDYARVTGNPQLRLYSQAGLTILGVAMSTDLGPFRDVRVRQAMNYAVDKDAINKGLYGGATTASQGMPPVLWGYNTSVRPYPYDVAKAKALREAGFPNGFTADMMVYANPRGYNPVGGAKLGEAVQGYLAKVGVTVKITQYEWGAYLDRLRHTPWEGFAISGWSGDNGDPDNFLGDLFEWDEAAGHARTNNNARHHNPAYDRLIQQGRQVTDQARRAQIYMEANRILHDDAPWIFINHTNQVRAARASVRGFLLNPLQMFFHMERVSLQ